MHMDIYYHSFIHSLFDTLNIHPYLLSLWIRLLRGIIIIIIIFQRSLVVLLFGFVSCFPLLWLQLLFHASSSAYCPFHLSGGPASLFTRFFCIGLFSLNQLLYFFRFTCLLSVFVSFIHYPYICLCILDVVILFHFHCISYSLYTFHLAAKQIENNQNTPLFEPASFLSIRSPREVIFDLCCIRRVVSRGWCISQWLRISVMVCLKSCLDGSTKSNGYSRLRRSDILNLRVKFYQVMFEM